jgi:hypothetical protein
MKKSLLVLLGFISGMYVGMLIAGCSVSQILAGTGMAIVFMGAGFIVTGLIPAAILASCVIRRKLDFFNWQGYHLEWSIVTIAMVFGGGVVFLIGHGILLLA